MNRFDRVDVELLKLNETFKEHAESDLAYWRKIDQQEGALGVWKWIAGLGGGSGIFAALSQWFGKH
jgi:hypothetical protein